MKSRLLSIAAIFSGLFILWLAQAGEGQDHVVAQGGAVRPPVGGGEQKVYSRGRKMIPEHVTRARHAQSHAMHGEHLKKLRTISADTYNCQTLGQCGPISDQDGCGDCYIHSGCGTGEDSFYTAGIVKSGSGFALSRQFMLDYHPELGGCGGGDEWEVAQVIMASGCPCTADYKGPGQQPGPKQPVVGLKMYKIDSMGYVDSSSGVANTQAMKDCMVKYGPLSVAVAAGSDWNGYKAGQILTGRNGGVNHAVMAIGWKTVNGKTVWLGQNSWSEDWGDKGTFWIQEGADAFGTEAFWTHVVSVTPPTPPTPPGPTPPVPPGPLTTTTITLSNAMPAGAYEVLPTGTAKAIQDASTAMASLAALTNPVPVTPPRPCAAQAEAMAKKFIEAERAAQATASATMERRIAEMEQSNKLMVESVLKIQKLLEGAPK